MNQQWGAAHFWAQGDAVSHGVAIMLLLLSLLSWSCIVGKAWAQWRLRRALQQAPAAYWQAADRTAASLALQQQDSSGLLLAMSSQAELAAQACAHGNDGMREQYLGATLQQSLQQAQSRLDQGLTLLASAGSVAPFVGLLGTVWGIYHAMIGLSGSSRMTLDQVAGPVGEALIMTAVGLLVAIPAVLAYNAFTRSNRLLLAALDAFAHALHAYLLFGIRPPSAGKRG